MPVIPPQAADPEGVAQVPSPRQKVVELAEVPLLSLDTARFPVKSAALPVVATVANDGTPVSEAHAQVVGNVANDRSPRKYCAIVPVVSEACLPANAVERSVWDARVPVIPPQLPPTPQLAQFGSPAATIKQNPFVPIGRRLKAPAFL